MSGPSGSWIKALVVSAALVVVPLLAWLAIPRPILKPPLPAVRRPTPAAVRQPLADDPADGARIVFGTITTADGTPLSGAQVSLDGQPRPRARTGADGSYRLRAVPLEDMELVVRADSHIERRIPLSDGKAGAQQRQDVELSPAPNVEGVVLDAQGEPASRANITCSDRQDSSLATVTTRAGRFKLPPRAAGCKAVAALMGHGDSPPTTLRPGDRNQLQLSAGASIAGEVFDSQGRAAPQYSVAIESFKAADGQSRMGREGTRQRINSPDGAFKFSGLQPGRYVLAVNAAGYPPANSRDIEVADGEAVRGIRITLEKGGALSGVVRDAESGDVIANATVAMDISSMAGRSARTRSDAEGSYLLEGLPSTAFSLRVSAKGYTGRILSGLSTSAGRVEQRDITLEKLAEGERRATVYSGIGAQLGMSPDGVIVGRVFRGGPAEDAGLQVGDVLMLIDGSDATSMTVGQAVEKIRGPEGTRIGLTITRSGQRSSLVITRGSVKR